jgi:D-inositol-3-phosphate glycosyltransferase
MNRIALLSVHTCPMAALGGKKTGGMNVYVRELSRELARQGVLVDIYTRSQDPCVPHINEYMSGALRLIHIPAGPEVPLDPDQIYPYLPQFIENMKAFAQLEELHYDFIYSHYWLSGLVARSLREAWKTPVAQMFHTLGRMKDRISYLPNAYNLRDQHETEIMRWADRLIVATPAEQAQLLWLYNLSNHQKAKIDIIPPGVDLRRFHPIDPTPARARLGMRPEEKILLFVGRIEPLKAVDTILQALALLKTESPEVVSNLSFVVVGGDPADVGGSNPEMERIKALHTTLNLTEMVKFVGAKQQDVLSDYYAAAEALIMPSDYESFGMVALEAMASGIPVIASKVGGLAFLIEDGVNGYHIPVREPSALAERIKHLLTTPGERDRLGEAAAKHAINYGWEAIATRLRASFERVTVSI